MRIRVLDDFSAPAPSSTYVGLIGTTLGFRVVSPRPDWCIGRSPGGPDGPYECANRPTSVNRKCTPCSVADATHASHLHHAHRGDADQIAVGQGDDVAEHLSQPNVLYVAAFRDGSLKVGTSTASRIATRLAEQGAWSAVIVAEAVNGYLVRVVEDAVTAAIGLAQSVSMVRKLQGLTRPVDDALLRVRLHQATARIHELIAGTEGLTPLSRWWSYGEGRHERRHPWDRVVRYPADVAVGAHQLSVVAVCGRAVLAELPNEAAPAEAAASMEAMVFDFGRLYGHEIEWGSFGSPTVSIQGSLF